MPKPKGGRADDALKITDENERILELWLSASVSEEVVEHQKMSNYLFVVNVDGQEERKLLSTAMDYADDFPASLEVCFYRRKLMFALPDVDRILNGSHTVTLYGRALPEAGGDVVVSPATATPKKSERTRRQNDDSAAFSIESAVKLLHAPLDLVDLITSASARQAMCVPADCGLRDVSIAACVGRELFPPARLRRYRPMRIELRPLRGDALCVEVRFGPLGFVTPPLPVAVTGKAAYRHVFLLGTRAPLEVWRDFLLEPLHVSAQANCTCVGAGSVSLRSAAADGQTHFSDVATLLPSRAAPRDRIDALSCGGEISLRVDLFIPLPPPRHVLASGDPAPRGAFLSRGIIRMPFATRWTAPALDAMLRALLQQPRAAPEDDVHVCTAARPDARGLGAADDAEAPAPQRKPSKQSARAKKKASLLPPRAPTPPGAFESPFDVVTPPGISGFEVMDDDTRIVCVEGPVAAVHEVLTRVAAAAGHDPRLTVLMNAELFVPRRGYLSFPPLVTPPVVPTPDAAEKEVPEKSPVEMKKEEKKPTEKKKSRAKSVEKPPPPPPPPPVVDTFDSAEAEAGATGGRMHRIRLRETIAALIAKQRHLVRRALSEECVRCYTKLYALCDCTSLLQVFERDLFPTPAELISLERVFGVSLELIDVFGREAFVSAAPPTTTAALGANDKEASELDGSAAEGASVVHIADLQPADAGRIVGFDAVRIERRRVPSRVAQRYPHSWWMSLCGDSPGTVLCAFPAATQPGATLRYRIEAQVVRCADRLFLYVLSCTSLAHSHVDSRNPAYEARRAATRWRGKRPGAAPHGGVSGSKGATAQDEVQAQWPAPAESDSSDEDARDEFPRGETGTVPRVLPALTGTARASVSGDRRATEKGKLMVSRVHSSRAARSRRSADVSAAEYDLCWVLYDRRAPRTRPQPPKGPPMYF